MFDLDGKIDTVLDYEDGTDLIQLTGGLVFEGLTVQNKFGGALIRADGAAEMVLQGVDAADITSDDFVSEVIQTTQTTTDDFFVNG